MRALFGLLLPAFFVVPVCAEERLAFALVKDTWANGPMDGEVTNFGDQSASLVAARLNHRDDCVLSPRSGWHRVHVGKLGFSGPETKTPVVLRAGETAWLSFEGSPCTAPGSVVFHVEVGYTNEAGDVMTVPWEFLPGS